MALRTSFTRVFGAVIPSAWANSIRDHLVTIATSNDVSSEGQMCVNTASDALVIHTGSGPVELARYGALSAVTLTTTQSFNVTSNNNGGFGRNGTWIEANLSMFYTGNGATGFAISVATNLPAPSYTMRVGDFTYVDTGTTVYEGSVLMSTSGVLQFYAHNSAGGVIGANPSFPIAVGDQLLISLRYPVI